MKNKLTDRFKPPVNTECLLKEDVLLVRLVLGSALLNVLINEPEA